ncbi:hypothetical protein LXL04_039486 [Taraxacum kok-saghyz]
MFNLLLSIGQHNLLDTIGADCPPYCAGEDFGTMSVSGIFIRFSVSSKMMFADDPPSIGILLTNKLAMCKFIRSQVGISVISNRIDVKI